MVLVEIDTEIKSFFDKRAEDFKKYKNGIFQCTVVKYFVSLLRSLKLAEVSK